MKIDASVDFLPFGGLQDAKILRKLQAYSKIPERYELIQLDNPRDLPMIYANLTMLLGMRLHSIIIAAMAGVPCVPIKYDNKVTSKADILGLSDFALNMDNLHNNDFVLATLERAWDRRRDISQNIHLISKEQQEKAEANFILVKDVLKSKSSPKWESNI